MFAGALWAVVDLTWEFEGEIERNRKKFSMSSFSFLVFGDIDG